MELSDLGEIPVAVLCVFIQHTYVGGRYTNVEDVAKKLPMRFRMGAKSGCEYLHKQLFLARKPKPNTILYSLRTDLDETRRAIIQHLREDPTIWERLKAGGTIEAPVQSVSLKDVRAHSDLTSYIRSCCNSSNGLSLVSVSESEDVDIEGDADSPPLLKLDLHFSVKCPACKAEFRWDVHIGTVEMFDLQSVRCTECGIEMTYRGLKRRY